MTSQGDEFFSERALAKRKAMRRLGAPAPGETADVPAPAQFAAPPEGARVPAGVVDVGAKPIVGREATAEGFLRLQPATVEAIREGRMKKGDPLAVAEVAAVMAAKKTPDFIPLCHPIPITGVEPRLSVGPAGVRCHVTVKANYRTGVEMEALAAVSAALLTVWDMVKYLEKDARGQYPATRIEGVRVLEKRKEESS